MALPLAPNDWRARAACRGCPDPEIFFPVGDPGDPFDPRNAEALAWCEVCPVRAECLAEALVRIPDGVAGGMTADQRRALLRHQRRRHQRTTRPVRSPSPIASDSATSVRRSTRDRGVALLVEGVSRADVAVRLHVARRTVDRWATLPAVRPLLPAPASTAGVITRREARRIG